MSLPMDPVDLYNAIWREDPTGQFGAFGTSALAECFGVSQRTVQRWRTKAEEQRNPFPEWLKGVEPQYWPEPWKTRYELTGYILHGWEAPASSGRPLEQYEECFDSPCDALKYMSGGISGDLDPWITAMVRRMNLVETDHGWCVVVQYERMDSDFVKQVSDWAAGAAAHGVGEMLVNFGLYGSPFGPVQTFRWLDYFGASFFGQLAGGIELADLQDLQYLNPSQLCLAIWLRYLLTDGGFGVLTTDNFPGRDAFNAWAASHGGCGNITGGE